MDNVFKLKLREKFVVRLLYYPVRNLQIAIDTIKYRNSEAAKKITRFKNIHKGKRCFVIGNGPSLRVEDLDKLCNEYTFAANRIYKMYDRTKWRPSYWMCVDPYIIKSDWELIENLPGIKFVSEESRKYGVSGSELLYMIYNHQPYHLNKYSNRIKIKFSKECSFGIEAGETVTYNAIQLAVYMGFKEIYLVGVDHNYSQTRNSKGELIIDKSIKDYFGDIKTEDFNIQNYTVSTNAYKKAQQVCSEMNIKIFNATRGGKLDVFQRINFEDII